MNKFVSNGSRVFLAFAWVVLCSLFADSANLDDLFSSNFVLHDDDEVASCPAQPTAPPGDQQTQPPGTPPHTPSRVIVDQDSPSLAADFDASTLVGESMLCERTPVIYETILTAESLHIKHHKLLI